MKRIAGLFALVIIAAASTMPACAEFTAETAHDFLQAQAAIYSDASEENVERFVAFMSDDITDVHFAYGREFSGKDHFRKNMPQKAAALLSYDCRISQIMMGTNVAVVAYHERTQEKKADGAIRNYSGRTIMVIEFNDDGLVTQLRRYQD